MDGEKSSVRIFLVGKTEEKKPLGRNGRRLEDVKMGTRDVVSGDMHRIDPL